MTPVEIDVLIYCYRMINAHPQAHAPEVTQALGKLSQMDYIRRSPTDGARFCTTEKGYDLIKQLCAIPLVSGNLVNALTHQKRWGWDGGGDLPKPKTPPAPPAPPAQATFFPDWMGPCPRVCAPWTAAEEAELVRGYKEDRMDLDKLAAKHGRAAGGVHSRLSKILGPDYADAADARLQRLEKLTKEADALLENWQRRRSLYDKERLAYDQQCASLVVQMENLRTDIAKGER